MCSADYYLSTDLTATTGDCNDNDADINPGNPEVCDDSVDNDCNGLIDEGCGSNDENGVNILSENFDDVSLSDRGWYDAGANSPTIFNDPPKGNVLEYAYSNESSTPSTGALRDTFTESDEVTIIYEIKYSLNWLWTPGDSGPHEVYLLTNKEHDYKGPAESHGTTYIEMHSGKLRLGFQDALSIDQSQIALNLSEKTEAQGVFGCNGSSESHPDGICWGDRGAKTNGKLWGASMTQLANGEWHHVKVHLKMNSIVNGNGVADGIMEAWINNQLVIDHRNVVIRTGANADQKWKQLMIAPYFHDGVTQDQKFWINNLKVYQGAAVTIPEAPLGLTIN